MTKNKQNFIIIIIYLGSMLVLAFGQEIALLINPAIKTDDDLFITFNSISNLAWYSMLFLTFIIIFKTYFRNQVKEFIKYRGRIISIIILGIIGLYTMSIVSTLILELIGASETSENQEQLNLLLDGTLFDKISLFLFAVLFAPIVEEFVFRKAILNIFYFEVKLDDGSKKTKIKKMLSALVAILVSGLVFGLIHVTSGDFEQIIYYGLLGCVLGIIYLVANKNLFAPIIVHLLLNLIAVLFLFTL